MRGRLVGMAEISYRRHRFPPDVIQRAVWLYLRFTLSYRDVEETLPSAGSTSPTTPREPRSGLTCAGMSSSRLKFAALSHRVGLRRRIRVNQIRRKLFTPLVAGENRNKIRHVNRRG